MKVPPGYRFRKPIFMFEGFYWRVREGRPLVRHRELCNGRSEPSSAIHLVSGPLDGDFFTLQRTPKILLSECAGECQASELHLMVGVEVMSLTGRLSL
jgi:hypothetical protein